MKTLFSIVFCCASVALFAQHPQAGKQINTSNQANTVSPSRDRQPTVNNQVGTRSQTSGNNGTVYSEKQVPSENYSSNRTRQTSTPSRSGTATPSASQRNPEYDVEENIPVDIDALQLELRNCNNKIQISMLEWFNMTDTHRKMMLANADKYCFDDLSVLFMLHLAPACATIAFF